MIRFACSEICCHAVYAQVPRFLRPGMQQAFNVLPQPLQYSLIYFPKNLQYKQHLHTPQLLFNIY